MRIACTCLAAALILVTSFAQAQPCPKVSYTTEAATVRKLIMTVNCLVANSRERTQGATPVGPAAVQVDTVRIIGPQHRGPYSKITVVILSIPVGDSLKTVLATPENPEANATATAGATCKAKINSDNTVDGQCNLTGGTMYIVYHN